VGFVAVDLPAGGGSSAHGYLRDGRGCRPPRVGRGCCAGRRPTGDDAAWQLGPRLDGQLRSAHRARRTRPL